MLPPSLSRSFSRTRPSDDFPEPELADDAEGPALANLEADLLDGMHDAGPREEADARPICLVEFLHLQHDRSILTRLRFALDHMRDGGDQPLGVGVAWIAQHVGDGALFDHRALLHDDDAIGDFRDNAKIVRDEHDAHVLFALQPPDQGEDLRLGGDVESRRRLVGDQKIGLECERHGDHDALALPTRELERILVAQNLRLRQTDFAEQIDNRLGAGRGGAGPVCFHDLRHLLADSHQRIERRKRILEDDGDRTATQAAHHVFPGAGEIVALEPYASLRNPHRRRQQAHDGIRGDRLAGAGLADDAEHLALPHVEGYVFDRVLTLHVRGQTARSDFEQRERSARWA